MITRLRPHDCSSLGSDPRDHCLRAARSKACAASPCLIKVPCYKFNVVAVVIFTHVWLVLGWVGSLQAGFLFEDASWESFVEKLD